MRINKYLAQHTDLSRRKADAAIADGRVLVNGKPPEPGQSVDADVTVTLDGAPVKARQTQATVVLMHKPIDFVCSRNGQGSRSVYSLLPGNMQHLNIAGRLDKDSSGLLVLTDDGNVHQDLTHPSKGKSKQYQITTNKPLTKTEMKQLQTGVDIGDERKSSMQIDQNDTCAYTVTLSEGRNRQLRRSFEAIGHEVMTLHRTALGPYRLGNLQPKKHTIVKS